MFVFFQGAVIPLSNSHTPPDVVLHNTRMAWRQYVAQKQVQYTGLILQ